MKYRVRRLTTALLGPGLLTLASCASNEPVAPSPTTDQVLSIQYHAHGEQGAMSGQESQVVADAYRRDIAKSAAAPSGTSSNLNGER